MNVMDELNAKQHSCGDLFQMIHNDYLIDGYTISLVARISGSLPSFGLHAAF
jgi:hypothetical protein